MKTKKVKVRIKDTEVLDHKLHDALSKEDSALAHYTFEKIGSSFVSTYEQWELGFLKDMHPSDEIQIWFRLCVAVQELKLTCEEERKRFIGGVLFGASEDHDRCHASIERAAESGFLAECIWEVLARE